MHYGEFLYTENTIAYWRFEGNSLDETPNNNDGIDEYSYAGYDLNYGRFSQGIRLEIDDHIKIGNESNFDFNHDSVFTISSWCRFITLPVEKDDIRCIVSKQYGNKYTTPGYFFAIDGKADDTGATLVFMLSDGSNYARVESKILITETDKWYSCIVTSNGTGKNGIKIYINGTDDGTYIDDGGYTNGSMLNNDYLYMGYKDNSDGGYLQADLDEVIIENIEWDAREIRNYYTQCMGMLAPAFG